MSCASKAWTEYVGFGVGSLLGAVLAYDIGTRIAVAVGGFVGIVMGITLSVIVALACASIGRLVIRRILSLTGK